LPGRLFFFASGAEKPGKLCFVPFPRHPALVSACSPGTGEKAATDLTFRRSATKLLELYPEQAKK
jgi:hypothetical protein